MSSGSPLVNFVLRGFQLVFASVVLGLSVSLVRAQAEGSNSPISLRYASFVGGLTFIAAIIGIAAEWVSVLQGKVGLLIDGIVTLVNVAGGVLLAIQIGGAKCSDKSDRYRFDVLLKNHLFTGGCAKTDDGVEICYNWLPGRENQLNARCMMCQADTVFMFFIVAVLLASGTMSFLRMKR
ncbi:hypothetical protein GRF29_1g3057418 [Pseudopithomyces chartarum]|uniref:MARVEL domain-containing protein n=1 Tax=Pseudopithomyces chartarum TaxID=1892770 RepID=A0AAN6RM62_9PLEO|nr:hypothetical protein GRF29_1g3057418 [Pseudopithomyces chartarum]